MFASVSTMTFTFVFGLYFLISMVSVLSVIIIRKVSVWVEAALIAIEMSLAYDAQAQPTFTITYLSPILGNGTPELAPLSFDEDNDPPTPALTDSSSLFSLSESEDTSPFFFTPKTRSILKRKDTVYEKKSVIFSEQLEHVRTIPNRLHPDIQAQWEEVEVIKTSTRKSKSSKKSKKSAPVPQKRHVKDVFSNFNLSADATTYYDEVAPVHGEFNIDNVSDSKHAYNWLFPRKKSPFIPSSPVLPAAHESITKPLIASHSSLKRFMPSFGSPKIATQRSPTMETGGISMDFSGHGSPSVFELFEDPRIVRQF